MPIPNEKNFRHINGIAINYAREPLAVYGSRGVGYTFYSTNEFYEKLQNCLTDLEGKCPLGKPDVITCAGTYVPKPNSNHNRGEAFDLDGVFWNGRDFVAGNFVSDSKFYLAVEAVFRKHFGTVLNFYYDSRHKDHIHFDISGKIDYSSEQRSNVLFLQAALVHVFGNNLIIDGIEGPITRGVTRSVLEELGVEGVITTARVWRAFLDKVIEKGFEDAGIGSHTPLELIQELYSLINTASIDQLEAKRLEAALTSFASHPDTMDWLENYR